MTMPLTRKLLSAHTWHNIFSIFLETSISLNGSKTQPVVRKMSFNTYWMADNLKVLQVCI